MALLQISEPGKTQAPHEKKFFIGIDLGTTNSLVALIQNGSPTVLTDVNEKELFPSNVQYKNDGTVVACCESEQDNLLTFRSIKRLIGKNIEDLQESESYLPCKYINDENIEGDIVECGVYNGNTMAFIGEISDEFNLNKKIFQY